MFKSKNFKILQQNSKISVNLNKKDMHLPHLLKMPIIIEHNFKNISIPFSKKLRHSFFRKMKNFSRETSMLQYPTYLDLQIATTAIPQHNQRHQNL